MSATEVDWSMGSPSARLADWDTALQLGRRVAGPGISVSPPRERARMREDFAELVPLAEDADHRPRTSMTMAGFRSRAWVMARSEWIRANLTGLQRLLEPLAERAARRQALEPGRVPAQGDGGPGGRAVRLRRATGARPVRRVPAARRRGAALLRRPQRRRGGTAVRAARRATSGCGSRSTRSPTACSSARRRGCAGICRAWSTSYLGGDLARRQGAGATSSGARSRRRVAASTRAWAASSCCSRPSSASCSRRCRG